MAIRASERQALPDRILLIAAALYVISIPIDAVAILPGRSPTALIGALLLSAWMLAATLSPLDRLPSKPTRLLLWSALLFVGWASLGLSWSADPNRGLERLFTYIGLALTIPALSRAFRRGTILPVVCYLAGATFLAISALLDRRTGELDPSLALGSDYRARPLSADPNGVAVLLAVGAAFALLLAAKQGGRYRVLFGVVALTCVLGTMATGSKTGAISLLMMAVALPPLAASGTRKHRIKIGSIALVVVACAVGLVVSLRTLFPPRVWQTIASLEGRDLTTRQDIWAAALESVDLWMPWGVGLNNSGSAVQGFYGSYHVLHNTFLEVGVETGLVGLILGLAFYIGILAASRYSAYRTLVLGAFIPIAAFSLTLSMFYYKVLWFVAALAAIHVIAASATDVAPREGIARSYPPTHREPWRPTHSQAGS